MDFLSDQYALSILLFFPLVWGLIGLFVPVQEGKANLYKNWVLVGSIITFLISLVVYSRYVATGADFQLTEKVSWIPAFGISYSLGIDGISLWLVMLTTFITPFLVLCSYSAIESRIKEYFFFILVLETGMLGAFFSLDIFLFYVFWEVMLIPMYFMIGIWGSKDRIYAANKFFIYTIVGSLLMLVAIFYVSYQHKVAFGNYSTAIDDLYRLRLAGDGYFSEQGILFLAFALAFAIKVPLFPLHTWLPDAHVQAPTAGSVVLAGVLLKMGGYGFLRFAFPMFPDAVHTYQMSFLILGAIAIVYGALVSMVQLDLKKLVAYSSVSHMGYVMIGLFSLNLVGGMGAMIQMLNHGISTGALFLLVGMIYERRHTREIKDFGGIAKVMPLYTIAFLIVTLSSVALPGTNGFVGEFLILLGSWMANKTIAVIAATGVILGAVYMLWMFQRVLFGPTSNPENQNLTDLNLREKLVLVPFLLLIVIMGVKPQFIFDKMEPSMTKLVARVQKNSAPTETATASVYPNELEKKVSLWNPFNH